MHSVALVMAVWSNAVVSGTEPSRQVERLLQLTGIDVDVIDDGHAVPVMDLWRSWADQDVRQVRLFLPRPGRPIALEPTTAARAAMRAGAILATVEADDGLVPRLVRGQLTAWDRVPTHGVLPLPANALREAERDFAVALREETEWLDAQVSPAADAELVALRDAAKGPPALPTSLPPAHQQLLTRSDRVLAILQAARSAPEPVSAADRAARMAALNRIEAATLTLQEALACAWVA
jgi:hypothetical protein